MKYRKQLLTAFIILTIITKTEAQKIWSSYSHSFNIQGYAGYKFRYKASVKVAKQDSDAVASLWIRVDRDGKRGFSKNMNDSPITTNNWRDYSLEGTINEDYTQIVLGVMVRYNGDFYIDDINLEILTKENKWKSIYETGFENNSSDFIQGDGAGSGTNIFFKGLITTITPKKGRQCFLIHGESVPNYGTNAKAGNYAIVNGIRLYYEIYGNGHPLLILHGNGGSIKDASYLYPELIKKYKIIAVDSRGQGKSTDTDEPLTYDIMSEDINALLNELKIDSAFIWGQSDGAILGLLLAMNHPQKVEKLLAFGANIQPDSSALFNWGIVAMTDIEKNSKDVKEKKLTRLMLDYPNIPFTSLSKIKAPVLIMAGDRDIIRPEHSLKLFQNIPNSQLCIIPGSTHAASKEKRGLFLELLYNFFDSSFSMPTTEDWFK